MTRKRTLVQMTLTSPTTMVASQPVKRVPSDQVTYLERIISGGQTGADRAALEAAYACGIPTGGTAPPRFCTTNGNDTTLRDKFGLVEMKTRQHWQQFGVDIVGRRWMDNEYAARSMRNVDDSNVTIAFRLCASPGTDGTISYCKYGVWGKSKKAQRIDSDYDPYRQCLVVTNLDNEAFIAEEIVGFIVRTKARVVNVCGHRSDATAQMQGYSKRVQAVLRIAFQQLLSIAAPKPVQKVQDSDDEVEIICAEVEQAVEVASEDENEDIWVLK